MKKKASVTFVIALITCTMLQAQLCDTNRVYDTVTDADTFYLFPPFKPCFMPWRYDWAPGRVMVQEYVATDTVTVYGVALTFGKPSDNIDTSNYNFRTRYNFLLMNRIGPSPTSVLEYTFGRIDSVSFLRSHPRFCWFRYEDDCDKLEMTTCCYEFYFDTPAKINRVVDTFYVGRERNFYGVTSIAVPEEYGGEYSPSIPSTIYSGSFGYTGNDLNHFQHCVGNSDRKWGVAFPIIGFRCGPVKHYWLDSCSRTSAILYWRNAEVGATYNVRLVGEDGSDTTFITTDTTIDLVGLSDSVRYSVMLRKQCHYATSNYDTTVYSPWSVSSFGTTIPPTVWRTVTVTSGNPGRGTVSGGGMYADSTTATLVASAFPGYEFDTWSDGSSYNPRSVLVTSDTSFKAYFRVAPDTTGIALLEDGDFLLRPNPTHGTVQVLLPTAAIGGHLALCDLKGRELEVHTVTDTTMDLDVSHMPAGTYLMRLTTAKGESAKKLVVRN